jgi:dephospho-CoA kinase
MLVVGLTGGIGSGKSKAADLFAELGVPIIDTDLIARELVAPGQPALKQITEHFGPSVLLDDGTLNRKRVAEICFANPDRRLQLEAILHPLIRQDVQEQLRHLNTEYAIVVVPLLIETQQNDLYDRILVIDCEEQIQMQRIHRRDNRSGQQIQQIMQAQASREQRLDAADDIITNTGSIEDLQRQIAQLDHKYLKLARA